MTWKLCALLRKDAILAWRSKIWTLFELFLPMLCLIGVHFMVNYTSKNAAPYMSDSRANTYSESNYYSTPYSGACTDEHKKMIHQESYMTDQTDHRIHNESQWQPVFQVPSPEKIRKDLDNCDKVTVLASLKDKRLDIYIPRVAKAVPVGDWADPTFGGYNKYEFVPLIKDVIKTYIFGGAANYTIQDIGLRSATPVEYVLPYIVVILGLTVGISVINLVRIVVSEKASVKPYLSAIGLPPWLFYTEHYIAAFLKNILTLAGALFWFTQLDNFDWFLHFCAVFIYLLGALSFAILISSMFTNSKRAIESVLIFWVLSIIVASMIDESNLDLLHALNINSAYKLFLLKSQHNSLANQKMGFGQLFSNSYVNGTLPGLFLLFMLIDVFWMFGLALLIDMYGGKLSMVKNLCNLCKSKKSTRSSAGADVILEGCVEEDKTRNDAPSDVELSEIVKIYSTGEKAVNGLTFRAIRGQVSILLGQNGCGKSTTFSMISGVTLPTSGSIKVGGIDAVSNRKEARKVIGFCPQYNPLYDKLTVVDHLRLVNALKGGSSKTFGPEATELLTSIGLIDKAHTKAAKLSGGMKRKLCVCMAMIGGSKVVLLDEPTAGMDPGARKDVQIMLEKAKVDRTILLTTHYMDEAERLGDWVFVMSYGKMAASGSLNYLKRKFGSGYVLTVVLDTKCDKEKAVGEVETICKKFVQNSSLKDQRGQMVEITLPEEQKSGIVPLLKNLESIIETSKASAAKSSAKSDKLKITTLGLSMSSLETVFIKICDECDVAIAKENKLGDKRKIAGEHFDELTKMKTDRRKIGLNLLVFQFLALLQKRFYYSIRNIYQIIFQVIVPMLLILTLILFMKYDTGIKGDFTEKLSMSEFPKSTVLLRGGDSKLKIAEDYLKKFDQLTIEKTDETNNTVLYYKYYRGPLGFIIEVDSGNFLITHNPLINKAVPILVATFSQLNPNSLNPSVPIDVYINWMIAKAEDHVASLVQTMMVPLVIAIAYALVTGPFVQFIIDERTCKFSHQQFLTGLSRILFWMANVFWDVVLFILVVTITMTIFASFGYYRNVIGYLIFILFMLLFAILPLAYLASQIIASPSKASTLLIVYQTVVMIIASMALNLIIAFDESTTDWLAPIFYLLCPPCAFLSAMFKILCYALVKEDPKSLVRVFIKFDSMWQWKGITKEITFLAIVAIFIIIVLILMQWRFSRVFCFKMTHFKKSVVPKQSLAGLPKCQAVEEQERLLHSAQPDPNATVIVTDLVRTFGKFRAVNGLCMTVRQNECFGLLGTNGAGKTTTFDILTGLRFPSGGSAVIEGKNVVGHNYVGYCPQFDSILPDLKCREALEIMAQLHGYAEPKLAVAHILACVGMVQHAHKKIRMCSGGQKRKISVGMAMLTRAKCVMMDEPTAGIDPRARREIWEILDWMREKSGSSIVLTSHSMEECEALCSRIAILRKGEMIALGTSQDLKSQYGNTYTMTLVLEKSEDREKICEEVKKEMTDAVLKTPATNITTSIVWELPKTGKDKWSDKYEKVEVLARKLKVKDFMLTQASLEDTFINLTDQS